MTQIAINRSRDFKIAQNAIKMFGEVFTPPQLINDMLDDLERFSGANVWSNPRLRILDPAAGIGNFEMILVPRLMKGLSQVIPDNEARMKHIITNMIVMCEINPKNVNQCRQTFSDANIIQGDFLAQTTLQEFDLIVGNPPYNAPCPGGKAHGHTLYLHFLEKCINLLAPNGYLVMVHPPIWRKPGQRLHDLMFHHVAIHSLKIYDKAQGRKTFGATTRYDYYVIQNAPKYLDHQTRIRFDNGCESLITISREMPFLPNHGFSIIQKLWNYQCERFSVTYGGGACSQESLDQYHRWPYVNSTCKTKGLLVHWAAREHPLQRRAKVVFADNQTVFPYYDPGYLGLTGHALAQCVANRAEGARLCKFLRSHLMQYVIAATKWSMFRTEHETFASLPWPKNETFADDQAVYTYFGLSRSEVEEVQNSRLQSFEQIRSVVSPWHSISVALGE